MILIAPFRGLGYLVSGSRSGWDGVGSQMIVTSSLKPVRLFWIPISLKKIS